MNSSFVIRRATAADLDAIRAIYNQGIEDRIATLDEQPKSSDAIARWWAEHDERYAAFVAGVQSEITGWASLNRFSARCAHAQIADLSIYVRRAQRGKGLGFALLTHLAATAASSGFKKIVLHALAANEHGKRLYLKAGFREVGVFRSHGVLDGRYVDVVAMERLLDAPG